MPETEPILVESLEPKVRDAFPLLAQMILAIICPPVGAATGLVQAYLGTPASRRTVDIIIDLDRRFKELEQSSVISVEKLLQNPLFNTIVITAVQIAMKTHQEEKIEAVRNAVLNSVFSSSPEEDKQLIFLRILDSLTVFDLKMLNIIYTNQLSTKSLEHFKADLEYILSQNNIEKELAWQSLKMLAAQGIIGEEVSGFGAMPLWYFKNNLGSEFIKFIGLPIIPLSQEAK